MSTAFVIHLHSGFGPEHFDLMLEDASALATWQFSTDPANLECGHSLEAKKLADHRRAYLTYEGPVSAGRGQVKRVDCGTYTLVHRDNQRWNITAQGTRLQGRFEISLRDPDSQTWTFTRSVT